MSSKLSMRDHFATQAVVGLIANENWTTFVRGFVQASDKFTASERGHKILAAEAYRIADAMITARKKK